MKIRDIGKFLCFPYSSSDSDENYKSSWNKRSVQITRKFRFRKDRTPEDAPTKSSPLRRGKFHSSPDYTEGDMRNKLDKGSFVLSVTDKTINQSLCRTTLEVVEIKLGEAKYNLAECKLYNPEKLAEVAREVSNAKSPAAESKNLTVVKQVRKVCTKHKAKTSTEKNLVKCAEQISKILQLSIKKCLVNSKKHSMAEYLVEKEASGKLEAFQKKLQAHCNSYKIPLQEKRGIVLRIRAKYGQPLSKENNKQHKEDLAKLSRELDNLVLGVESLDIGNRILLLDAEGKEPQFLAKQIAKEAKKGQLISKATQDLFQDLCMNKLSDGLCPPKHIKMAFACVASNAAALLQEECKNLKYPSVTQKAILESKSDGIDIKLSTFIQDKEMKGKIERKDHLKIKFESLPHLVFHKGQELHLRSELIETEDFSKTYRS